LHILWQEIGGNEKKNIAIDSVCFVLSNRLTPRLLRTCRTNLVSLCQLPKNWSMNTELDDIQVGMYLGCLYQQRQNV
jgi:hypothetical protein